MKNILITTSLLFTILSKQSFAQWAGSTVSSNTLNNVGIGTTAPTSKLQLNTTQSYSTSIAYLNSIPFTLNNTQNLNWNSSTLQGKPFTGTFKNIFEIYNNQTYTNTTISKPALIVDFYANVAIGKLSPSYSLDVEGTIAGINGIYSGNMRIGPQAASSIYSGYRLSVDGDLICKKAIVQTSSWADYVFAPNYELMPLEKVEEYITENNHLPNMPSENYVLANGQDISEIQKLQQAKIEELTLYLIELKKEIEILKSKK
jgi:hypothetical protein